MSFEKCEEMINEWEGLTDHPEWDAKEAERCRHNTEYLLDDLFETHDNSAMRYLIGYGAEGGKLKDALDSNPNQAGLMNLQRFVIRVAECWFSVGWAEGQIQNLNNLAVKLIENDSWEW